MAAAFLHDTALEKANLPFRAEGAYAPEQEQLWRAHPVKAAEVLAGLPHVDRLTFEIIAQHEECPNGSGFPKGLAQNALNPLSAVVALANRFDHTLVENPGQALPELLKEFKVKHLGIFDLPQLTDLEKTILASF